ANSAPVSQTIDEDNDLVFSSTDGNAIWISDADADPLPVRVTLTATNGVLSLSGTTGLAFMVGDGSGDATMTFTGILSDINAALEGLRYSPNANYNGSATVRITTNDLGNTGSGGGLSDTKTVNVT